MASYEIGRPNEEKYQDLIYGMVFLGNQSVLARTVDDPVKDEEMYLHHNGDNMTLYQESCRGIKILLNSLDGVTTVLSNYPIKQNDKGALYIVHPSIPSDLTPVQIQELFIS